MIAVGHAVFHLIGAYDSVPAGDLIAADLPPGFVEITPTQGAAMWPPKLAVTMPEVERLISLGPVTVARRGPR